MLDRINTGFWHACLSGMCLILALLAGPAWAVVDVGIVINPYAGDRAGPEIDGDALAMTEGGLAAIIESAGGRIVRTRTVTLTAQDKAQYGRWNRFGLASGHLANMATENFNAGLLNLGLYNNCSSLMGMLGGLQHATQAGSGGPQRIGLVWIDAHGDYNTPETTLSGMLGGMPVAIAAGDGLIRMRKQAGMDEPLPKSHIVMVGVRDTDPLEQERIERDAIPQISTEDVRNLSSNLHEQMRQLTAISDIVYVHVDLDVLDPAEVSGHPLTVPNGPTGKELAAAIEVMFSYPKTAALGIASYPHLNDPGKLTLKAIHDMVAGAVSGIAERD
ncbi:MAG: arginase family protein [Gammaproteobacteria bacterium]|nr:arginase family protein [Gammaproteobacteria bacterium]